MNKIGKYTDVIDQIKRKTYIKITPGGEIVSDETKTLPEITFTGTVKLHGTFAGIGYNAQEDEFYFESKKNIITPENDNAGFARFMTDNLKIFKNLRSIKVDDITIMGEWAGPGIQKNTGINHLPGKIFFMFGVKYTIEGQSHWLTNPEDFLEDYITAHTRSIFEFPTYCLDIDFNNPKIAQEKISDIIAKIDQECPVAKHFGFDGPGEGVVWCAWYQGERYTFKSKGEKFQTKKNKQPKEKDPLENEKLQEAERLTPSWRLEQMLTETYDLLNNGTLNTSKTGEYIKAVIADIKKEETPKFPLKNIQRFISKISVDYLRTQIENNHF